MQDNRKPLVSCIVPTRNRASLVKRALHSIVQQTYDNLEILVVDDASNDDTASIVHNWMQSDQRIRYIKNPTALGGGGARNKALNAASGQYVAFLDDDDEWLPEKIELQINSIESDAIGFAGCRFLTIGRGSAARLSYGKNSLLSKITKKSKAVKLDYHDLLQSNCRMSPSTVIINREQLVSLEGFDESLQGNQGRDLFLRYFKKNKFGIRLEKALVIQHQEHGYGRISQQGGARIESLNAVHARYRNDMPVWMRNYDQARILLTETRTMKTRKARIRGWFPAVRKFYWQKPIPFLILYAKYFLR